MKLKKLLLATTCLMIFSGCSIFPEPTDQPRKYVLTPCEQKTEGVQKKEGLVVDTPVIYSPLDTTRVAILPTSMTLDYIADVEWADRLVQLVHDALLHSLQNSELFASTGKLSSSMQARLMLKTDVRKFEKNAETNQVEIEYYVQLLSLPDRNTIKSRLIKSNVSLDPKASLTTVMETFNRSNQETICKLIHWLADIK
jgi:ABC-type uncharacterized transport system auxiliary subunit